MGIGINCRRVVFSAILMTVEFIEMIGFDSDLMIEMVVLQMHDKEGVPESSTRRET